MTLKQLKTFGLLTTLFLCLDNNLFAQMMKDSATTCYSTTHSSNRIQIEQGLVGIYKGRKYYYEEWIISDGNLYNKSILFLRTDTIKVADTLDFCFVELDGADHNFDDTIIFHKLDKRLNNWVVDSTMTIQKFPTNPQPLFHSTIAFPILSYINQTGDYNTKLYFKYDSLYLDFWTEERYSSTSTLIRWTYRNNGKQFRFVDGNEIRTVKDRWY